jgi:hypothetical protein
VADAAKPGGPLATGGEAPLTVAQAFSVAHREDLLDTCTEADVAEMRRVVLDALTTVAGESCCHAGECPLVVLCHPNLSDLPRKLLQVQTIVIIWACFHIFPWPLVLAAGHHRGW